MRILNLSILVWLLPPFFSQNIGIAAGDNKAKEEVVQNFGYVGESTFSDYANLGLAAHWMDQENIDHPVDLDSSAYLDIPPTRTDILAVPASYTTEPHDTREFKLAMTQHALNTSLRFLHDPSYPNRFMDKTLFESNPLGEFPGMSARCILSHDDLACLTMASMIVSNPKITYHNSRSQALQLAAAAIEKIIEIERDKTELPNTSTGFARKVTQKYSLNREAVYAIFTPYIDKKYLARMSKEAVITPDRINSLDSLPVAITVKTEHDFSKKYGHHEFMRTIYNFMTHNLPENFVFCFLYQIEKACKEGKELTKEHLLLDDDPDKGRELHAAFHGSARRLEKTRQEVEKIKSTLRKKLYLTKDWKPTEGAPLNMEL